MITHQTSNRTIHNFFILTATLLTGMLSTTARADGLMALSGRTLVVQKQIAFNGKDLAFTLPGSQCQIVFKATIKDQPKLEQMIEPGTAIELRSMNTLKTGRLRAMMVPDLLDYISCPANRAPASNQSIEDSFQKDFGDTFKIVGTASTVEKN